MGDPADPPDTIGTSAGDGRTTISVSPKLADELYLRKTRGDTYEEVIWRLVDSTGERLTSNGDD